jgi:hypothetical protein
MANDYADSIYIVEAKKDGSTQYWAAAVRRDEALAAVRDHVLPAWALAMTQRRLTPGKVAALRMHANSVRLLKFTPWTSAKR